MKSEYKEYVYQLIFVLLPFITAYLIWGLWMQPETYWQKLSSIMGSFITIIILFSIEMHIF